MAPTPQKRAANADGEPKTARRKITELPEYGLDTITVKVGKENQQVFAAHNHLLVRHSDFFRAALTGNWKEKKDRAVPLPEQDPEIFKIFQHFLYSGEVCSSRDGDRDGLSRDEEWLRLADAWIFGDTILSTFFKDAVVDAIIAKIVNNDVYPSEMQVILYPKSIPGAKIRNLLVDVAVWGWSADMSPFEPDDESMDFFHDAFFALNKMKEHGCHGDTPYEWGDTCRYHEHGEDSPCYRTMF